MSTAEAYLTTTDAVALMERPAVERLHYVITSLRGQLYHHGSDALIHLNRQMPQRVGLAHAKAHTLALLDACERYLEQPC